MALYRYKFQMFVMLSLLGISSCGRSYDETQPIRKDVTVTVFASGTLQAKDSYELKARTDGYIEKLEFEENHLVEEGQLLAVIDNKSNQFNAISSEALYGIAKSNTSPDAPKLSQARNTVNFTLQRMQQDSTLAMKYKVLSDANALARIEYDNKLLEYQNSRKEYENALQEYEYLKKQAREQLVINESQKKVNKTLSSYNELKVIKAGKVYQKFKEVGDFVRQGETIALIGNADKLYARVNIDEQSIGKIQIGQEAVIKLNIDATKTYRGKVSEILPSFDESAQSFIAKIEFTEPFHFKIINTQLQTNIVIETVENALLIPRRYLGFGNEVIVKGEEEPIEIETKIVSSKWVQVISGLEENSVIVAHK